MGMSPIEEFQGFKVHALKFSADSKFSHHILLKKHNVRELNIEKPGDRTLFIVNLPPYATQDAIKNMFAHCGKVTKVHLHKKPTAKVTMEKFPLLAPAPAIQGFKVAYVVFNKSTGLNKALSLPADTVLTLSTKDNPVITGLAKWSEEYNNSFVNVSAISEEATAIMADYDRRKEEEKTTSKQEPDDEGWVTITSAKKKKPQAVKLDDVKNKKKKKKRPLVHLYAFQQREENMEKIAQMRKKHEEDKKRINLMKASRKFRPY